MKDFYWEHFPHQADIGIRGLGLTREQAFEQAAIALTAVITDPDKVEPEEKLEITCQAPDDELLLVDWLNGLLYEMDTRRMLFSRFDVRIEEHPQAEKDTSGASQHRLNATAWGQKTDVSKHHPAVEVKAATYTALSVRQDENGNWIAQCIVDV